ncbi:2,3-bisphosphoglycerate-independent phosphoglycerate mutase, partial [Staphylococcus aureus]
QLSEIFANRAFEGFKVEQVKDLFYATFTKYNDNIDAAIVFEKVDLNNTIGEIAQNNNLTQLRIAETEKY